MASQYGYTLEEFKGMTLRTLNGCLEMISIRTHNEFALNARVHGMDVELRKVTRQVRELSDDARKMTEQVHRDAIKRKFEERKKKS